MPRSLNRLKQQKMKNTLQLVAVLLLAVLPFLQSCQNEGPTADTPQSETPKENIDFDLSGLVNGLFDITGMWVNVQTYVVIGQDTSTNKDIYEVNMAYSVSRFNKDGTYITEERMKEEDPSVITTGKWEMHADTLFLHQDKPTQAELTFFMNFEAGEGMTATMVLDYDKDGLVDDFYTIVSKRGETTDE